MIFFRRKKEAEPSYFRSDPCPLCGWISVKTSDGICVNCNNVKPSYNASISELDAIIDSIPERDGYCHLCRLNPIADEEERLCMKCLVAQARRENDVRKKLRPMDPISQAPPRENFSHLGPNDPHFCGLCKQWFSGKQEYIDHHEKNCKVRS